MPIATDETHCAGLRMLSKARKKSGASAIPPLSPRKIADSGERRVRAARQGRQIAFGALSSPVACLRKRTASDSTHIANNSDLQDKSEAGDRHRADDVQLGARDYCSFVFEGDADAFGRGNG
jgi:hypothetical protein